MKFRRSIVSSLEKPGVVCRAASRDTIRGAPRGVNRRYRIWLRSTSPLAGEAAARGRRPHLHVVAVERIGQHQDRATTGRGLDRVPGRTVIGIIVHVIEKARLGEQVACVLSEEIAR